MKVIVDRHLCQGHALCSFTSPEVYLLDEQGYNSMGEFTVKPGQEEAARRGAEACPEGAIRIVEEE
jgi:ferredoxin